MLILIYHRKKADPLINNPKKLRFRLLSTLTINEKQVRKLIKKSGHSYLRL